MPGSLTLRREPSLRLKTEAFPFQHDAVRAIRDLEYGAIFHEQGLGKTKIAIDLLTHWLRSGSVDTVLLVVKKSLVLNWQTELTSHTELVPRVIGNNRAQNYHAFNSPARLLLTHYEAVRAESARFVLFLNTRKVGAILDESTKIKNPDSRLTQVFFRLSPLFRRRVIMTGTPVANRPFDIWAQMFFLDHGATLGDDFKGFKRKTDLTNEMGEDPNQQHAFEDNVGRIHRAIAHFTVRETKESGVVVLPDKEMHTVESAWEPRQFNIYSQYQDDLRAIIFRDGVPRLDDADNVLKRLLRLVQIASYPGLVDERYDADPGKLDDLVDLVERITRSGEKAIIWTSFVGTARWLRRRLTGYGAATVHGEMDIPARHRSISRFMNEDETKLLVATTGSAKEGLTLTVANHAVFFDRGFSLDDYLQAQDRIHRISQRRSCHIYNLVMRGSVDEWVDALLGAKHKAASLAVGDLTSSEYTESQSYDFATILRNILGE